MSEPDDTQWAVIDPLKLERVMEALRVTESVIASVEWVSYYDNGLIVTNVCAWCGNSMKRMHALDCPRALALKAIAEVRG